MSPGWRDRQPLSGADLTDFLALRRLCGRPEARVRQVGETFVDNGRPVLPFIADGLGMLIEVGHARFGEPDTCGMLPVVVTASGRARYEQLCDQQRITAYPVVVIDPMPQQ